MSEHNEDPPFLPGHITSIEMGVAIVLALITSTGNLMVVIAVYKDPYKELRTISNYLVVNLAVADLIVGLIVEPIWALQFWVKANQSYSVAANLLLVLSVDASCLTVLFLTVERYTVLEKPLRRETLFNVVSTKIYIFLIWVAALVISSLIIPFWNPVKERGYYLFLFTGIGCFLLLIMLSLYIRMFVIIRKFNNSVIAKGAQQRLIQPGEACIQARKREQEVAKAIFLFFGTFALCWLPSVVTNTIKYSQSITISAHVCRAFLFIGLLNSALNPIVYTFRMPSFRRAIGRIFDFRASEVVPSV